MHEQPFLACSDRSVSSGRSGGRRRCRRRVALPGRAAPGPGRPAPPAPAGAARAPRPGARRATRRSRPASGVPLERREQPPHRVHADLDRTLRPQPLDHLEVRRPRTVRVSSRWPGWTKPAIVASTSAFDSASDSTTCAQACALTAAEGRAARQRTWWRLPDAVSSGPVRRRSRTRRRGRARPAAPGSAQRSSWSTSRPSIFAVPSSSPRRSWKSASVVADRREEAGPGQLVLAARLGRAAARAARPRRAAVRPLRASAASRSG